MRIISDFHDYYDVGMQNGIDPKLPYKRFRREEDVAIRLPRWGSAVRYSGWSLEYYEDHSSIIFLGFAGTVYPVVVHFVDAGKIAYFFDHDKIPDDFFYGLLEYRWSWRRRPEKDRANLLTQAKKELLEIFELKSDPGITRLFNVFKTAIFVYRLGDKKVVLNERLNQYDFPRILPPMQAFQELEMYVGSYLTQPVIEEPPISDKIKAEIHGFDKFSFRKAKGP